MTAGTKTTHPGIDDEMASRLKSLPRDELESETIEAIREHRRLLAADEVVYQEWQQAIADAKLPLDQIESMKEDCLRRRHRTLEQQALLSFMLDLLGFTPRVPETEQSAEVQA